MPHSGSMISNVVLSQMTVARIQPQENRLETVILTAGPHISERKENTRTSKTLEISYFQFFFNFICA